MPSENYVRDGITASYRRREAKTGVAFTDADISGAMKRYYDTEQSTASHTAGKQLYDSLGSEAAPGFIDQFLFNIKQHGRSFVSGNVGMAGYVAGALGMEDTGNYFTNLGEELRLDGQRAVQREIANDVELQALVAWQEDKPVGWDNFWQFDMAERTLASALPSIVEMTVIALTTKGVGSILSKGIGGGIAKVASAKGRILATQRASKAGIALTEEGARAATRSLTIDSISKVVSGAGMMGLEGSSQYNEAMSYLVDEQGLSVEEAQKSAGMSVLIYAPIAGALEYLPMGSMLKKAGIFNQVKETGAKMFAKSVSGVVRKAGHLTQDLLSQAAFEASTEWMQYMAQVSVQVPYKQGWGATPEESLRNFSEAWKREAWSPEARESFFGGALAGGAISIPTSILNKTPNLSTNKDDGKVSKDLNRVMADVGASRKETTADERKAIIQDAQESNIESDIDIDEDTFGRATGDNADETTIDDTRINREPATEREPNLDVADSKIDSAIDDKIDKAVSKADEAEALRQQGGAKKQTTVKPKADVVEQEPELTTLQTVELIKLKKSGVKMGDPRAMSKVEGEKIIAQNQVAKPTQVDPKLTKEQIVKFAVENGVEAPKFNVRTSKKPGIVKWANTELAKLNGAIKATVKPVVESGTKKEMQAKSDVLTAEIKVMNAVPRKDRPKDWLPKVKALRAERDAIDVELKYGKKVAKGTPATKATAPTGKDTLQDRMTTELPTVANPRAKKWVPKELVKTKVATQFIGQGKAGSSTSRYEKMYNKEGVSNTGNYTSDDIIFIAANGNRGGGVSPIVNGKLQGQYRNIDKAIEAGATIIADTEQHLQATAYYNTGEVAIAKYLTANGYERQGNTGQWKPAGTQPATTATPATKPTGETKATVKPTGKKIQLTDKLEKKIYSVSELSDGTAELTLSNNFPGDSVAMQNELGLATTDGLFVAEGQLSPIMDNNIVKSPAKVRIENGKIVEIIKPAVIVGKNATAKEITAVKSKPIDINKIESQRDSLIDERVSFEANMNQENPQDVKALDEIDAEISVLEAQIADYNDGTQATIATPATAQPTDEDIVNKLVKGESLTKAENNIYRENKATFDVMVKHEVDNPKTQEDIDIESFLDGLVDEDNLSDELEIDNSAKKEDVTEGAELVGDSGLTQVLLDRLHKQFPNIKVEIIEGVIEVNGVKAFGLAMKDIVKISKLGSIDTIPHEYAHIWVAMMRDTQVIKLGIQRNQKGNMTKAEAEEALVQKIGEYYTNKIKDGTYEKNLMRKWLERLLKTIKALFGNTDALNDIIGDMFVDADFSATEAYYDGIGYSVKPENSDVNNIAQSTGGNDSVMFLRELGINLTSAEYRTMVELAEESSDVSEFMREFAELVEMIAGKFVDIHKSVRFKNELKQFFQLRHSSTYYYTENEHDGVVNSPWEMIYSKDAKDNWEVSQFQRKREFADSPGRLIDKLTGKLLSLTAIESHLEHGLKHDKNKTIETHHISKNDILNHLKEDGKYDFYAKNRDGISPALIEKLNRIFSKSYIDGRIDTLYVITGSKGGDNSQLTFANVEGDIPQYDVKDRKAFLKNQFVELNAYLQKEVDAGNMTKAQMKDIINKNTITLAVNPLSLIQTRGIHEWAKQVRHPKYLHPDYWKGIEDFNNRLKIDMSEGKNPTGMDKLIAKSSEVSNTIMLISKDDIVKNAQGKSVPYSDFDGETLTSGAMFRVYEEIYGYKPENGSHRMSYAKTTIHDSNKGDYLGMKHAEFRLPPGLKFYLPDGKTLIAEVVLASYNGKLETRFKDASGNFFDRIASDNEAKNVAGRFETKYQIHGLTEHNIKLLTTNGNKSKNTSALPFAAFDMMLTSISDDAVKAVAESLIKYNAENIKKHSKVLFGMLSNPTLLATELKRELADGEIPNELQQILLKDASGNMLMHRTNVGLLREYIANKYIKDYMLKGRRGDSSQTQAAYQPDHSLSLDDGQVRFGIGNKAAWKQAVNLFVAQDEGNRALFNGQDRDGKLKLINDWLDGSPQMYVLASRQPVNLWTTARPMRVMSFDLGSHSNVSHTSRDIREIFEGDHDGDKGYYDFFRNEDVESGYLASYLELFKKDKKGNFVSESLAESNKLLYLPLFGEKLEKPGRNNLLVYSDMYKAIENADAAEGAVGIIVTKASQSKSMALKDVEIQIDKTVYTMKQPLDKERFPIALLDTLSQEDMDKYITGNGDSIVKVGGEQYLETTVEHVYSILTQMATDDAKFGLLSKLPPNYIEDLMFNGAVSDAHRKIISGFALGYFNQLGRRQGKLGGKELDLNGLLRMAGELYSLYESDNKDAQLQSSIGAYQKSVANLSSTFEKKNLNRNASKTTIRINNYQPTVIEEMLISLGRETANRPFKEFVMSDILQWADNIDESAHIIAAQSVVGSEVDASDADVEMGIIFAEDFHSDYKEIIDKYYTVDGEIKENMQFDKNEKFEEMFNTHAERWNAMTDAQKQVATIRSLTELRTVNEQGVPVDKIKFEKLFPVRFQFDSVYELYSDKRQEAIEALVENNADLDLAMGVMNKGLPADEQLIFSNGTGPAKLSLALSRLKGWRFAGASKLISDVVRSAKVREILSAKIAKGLEKGKCS